MPDLSHIHEIASAIGTSVAGKKAALGGMFMALTLENITISHMIFGIIVAALASITSVTIWGKDVEHDALEAKRIALETHEKSEKLNSALHLHAIEAERRLGGIESDIRIIRNQNNYIIEILKQRAIDHGHVMPPAIEDHEDH